MKKSKKRILVVVESIDVENSSGSKANVALIKNLHKQGFDLNVFHYTRREIDFDEIPSFAIKENRRSFLFYLSRIERHLRLRLHVDIHKFIEHLFGFSFTLLNDRNSIVRALKKIDDQKVDLVITLSQGSSFRPHHALLKVPQLHSIWMAYIHDPYPMHSYPRPYDYVEPGHQKKRIFFLRMAQTAKHVAYPSKLLADWMESYYPPLRGKAVIIPHQISDELPQKKVHLPSFFKENHFNIIHAGTLLRARNPLPLIEGYRLFLEEIPEAKNKSHLLFIGKRSKYTKVFQKIQQQLPQFYSSDSYVPFSQVLAIQQKASVNVIIEAQGPTSPFLPGKFPHCIQAEKPILLLGPYYSESRRLLGERYQFWSEIDDKLKIKEIIKNLYLNWLQGNSDLPGKDYLKSYLSAKNLEQTIESLDD